jgi:hypothetical protein
MEPTWSLFEEQYRDFAARLLRPLKAEDGIPEPEIVTIEQSLGFQLPQILRQFYRLAGNWTDLNQGYESVNLPGLEDNHLVFAGENQGVCFWSLAVDDIALPDPPVFVNLIEEDWELECDRLSDFLITMFFWQAVNGGMPYIGIAKEHTEELLVPQGWQQISLPISGGNGWGGDVLMAEGQLLYMSGSTSNKNLDIQAGARTKELFHALEKTFGLSWDYNTLDDQ